MAAAKTGRLGRAARKWAKERRESGDLGGSKLILVELAQDAADLADRAREEDPRVYLAAASRLQQLIMAVERDRDGGRSAGPSDARIDSWAAEMAELMRSGPNVGDGA